MADGVWKTIKGRRVFIEEGQSLTEAMKKSGKFKMDKKDIKGKLKKQFEEKNIEKKEYKTMDEKIKYIQQDEQKIIDAIDNSNNSEEAGKRMCEVLQERQGFNKKPQKLNPKEFDKLQDKDYIKLYRGISDGKKTAEEYIDQFKNGKNQYGDGLNAYGVGHYTSTNKEVAKDYGTTMEIALPKNAKIATINMNEAIENDLQVLHINGMKEYTNNMEKYYNKYGDNVTRILDEVEREPSAFAILEGYDAVRVIDSQNGSIKGETYMILNRGKVIIKDE